MYKIAISGKANVGKDTVVRLITQQLVIQRAIRNDRRITSLAFATPIKQIVQSMFPKLPPIWLYGSSKYRDKIIPNAVDSHNQPLTVRQLLLDIGTNGRRYDDQIWISAFGAAYKLALQNKPEVVLVSDARFGNEIDYLQKHGFFLIRVLRDTSTKVKHISDTGQDGISDSEFDFVIHNNSTLKKLRQTVKTQVVPQIIAA